MCEEDGEKSGKIRKVSLIDNNTLRTAREKYSPVKIHRVGPFVRITRTIGRT